MKFRSERTRIAIVGAAYRMPGVGGEGFWEALTQGRDLVSSVAADRWESAPFLHRRRSEPGTSYTFAAGSLGDVAGFDAAFFGISPREAEQMDPQQRILLELAWEALESARIPASALRGARCGVYVGLSSIDYAYRRADDLASLDASSMTGNTGSIAANRISYFFDLKGPSMALDTACSSSLVALHQACQSIRHGETEAALVGGISLHLHPYAFVGFSKASMLSPEGRCRVFDAQGDGYVRSEGGAVVLLKPLAQAIADADPVLGVIVETGINNDGRKSGLTVPSHIAQAQLLREVYERASVAPPELHYLEAHGTGTPVGDPIEARAIGEALGQHRPADRPLPIGSVKSHVGHLEAASGMAGLMKVLGVLQHRRVPANLHLTSPNPHIDFGAWNLTPVTAPLDLPAEGRLIVGVSAFGFGGTNAHAVLSNFEAPAARARGAAQPPAPLVLSARSPQALKEVAARMAQHLRTHPEVADYDIAYSALVTREQHCYRLAARVTDRDRLAQGLEGFAREGSAPGMVTGKSRPEASAPAFIFSGNGSQWAGMGVELSEQEPVFREGLEEIDSLLAVHSGRSVVADLRAARSEGGFERTEIAQPALFALQVALVRLLRTYGLPCAAVCGHSVGEVAAAWASGALSLKSAVRVIHERSARQGQTRGGGRMAAVALGAAELTALIERLGLASHVAVAGINAPGSSTVAGAESAISQLARELARRRIACRPLALDYAFHSRSMDSIEAQLLAGLEGLECATPSVPFYSSVSGGLLAGGELDASYWWRNIREPVRFEAAVRAMLGAGINTFIEIGPRPVLLSYIEETARSAGVAVLSAPTLSPKDPGAERVRSLAHQLELSGAPEAMRRHFPQPGQKVDLPRYPWQRERFWHPGSAEASGLLGRRRVHPLLGDALPGAASHWERHLDATAEPALADHSVGGTVVFPAAGFVEMALAAAAARSADAVLAIEDLEILAPLVLERDHSKVVRLSLSADDGSFTVESRERAAEPQWRTHVKGRVVDDAVASPCEVASAPTGPADLTAEAHYALARSLGLAYGPGFQSVTAVWLAAGEALGSLTLPHGLAEPGSAYLLHPAYLDGAFQLLMDLTAQRAGQAERAPVTTFLPVRIDRLELSQPRRPIALARVRARAARHPTPRGLNADFALFDSAGAQVALARGVRFRAAALQPGGGRAAEWLSVRAIPRPRRDRALELPAAAAAARRCAERLQAPARLASRQRFVGEVEPLLDALCAAFAERALRAIAGEAPIELERLQSAGQLAPQALPLARAVLQMLIEDGVLRAEDGRWEWTTEAARCHFPDPREIWASLIADYPDYAPVIVRAGIQGARLPERLSGAAPRQPEGSRAAEGFSWAESCRQDEAAGVFGALEDLLSALGCAQPAEERLRILLVVDSTPPPELGDAVLPRLDENRCELVLAASSREALSAWQSSQERAALLESEVLDLDDPSSEPPQKPRRPFDVVVLTEGLSAAADPARRLESLRRLIYPGGMLILLDQHPSRTESLRSTSAPRARRQPAAWTATLAHAGFAEIEPLADVPGAAVGPYLMFARAAAAPGADIAPRPWRARRGAWILAHDTEGYSGELAQALGAQLKGAGQKVIHVVTGAQFSCESPGRLTVDATSTEHWDRVLVELERTGTSPEGWVHLAGLDVAAEGASSGARARALENRAAVLLAWLQASSRRLRELSTWVIAAQAASGVLPGGVPRGTAADRGSPDRLRDAALWGLARVAMQECPDQSVRWIDLADPIPSAPNAERLARELLEPDEEDELVLCAAGRFALRLESARELAPAALSSEPARLDFSLPGSFRHLEWVESRRGDAAQSGLAEGEVEIEVRAAGLNFRDVMYAMGLLPDEAIEDGFCGPALGMEASGIVRRVGSGVELSPGEEVIAVAPAALAERVRTQAFAVARKPAAWSFEAAATVPTAFFTAYHALAELARLEPGERVLIHGAAGGVGMAAIQVARHLGAEVFASAGTPEKRELVSLLGADRVFDSRSLRFADEVLDSTGGAGVDVVLNSLAGEAMRRSLRLLRPFGRMVELGKRDFYENTRLGLRPFRNNIAYFAFDADQLMARRPELTRRVFKELMALFASGALRPLPYRAFQAPSIEAAFRQMQASRHIGKLVVTFPEGFHPRAVRPLPAPPPLRADATYLVTGGLAGFGLRTAEWLASRGARHLVLLSRSGSPAAGEAAASMAALKAAGVIIECLACDVSDLEALRAALEGVLPRCPPLRGIVHAAAVIEDALIRDLSRGQLHRVLAPKIAGALNLHSVTLGCELDFFVLYSSATTLFGNPGQAAYVAANMALEAFAAERRAQGLPASCIGFGPIADAGYLARHPRVREALVGRIGGRALEASQALRALDTLLGAGASNIGYIDLEWGVLARVLPGAGAPKFSGLARRARARGSGHEPASDLRVRLMELPESELLPALTDLVRHQVARILRIAPERIEPGVSLPELGMDSLMGVELAASLEEHLGVHLSALSLSDVPTAERLAGRLAQQLRPAIEADEPHPTPADVLEERVRSAASQHAAETAEIDPAQLATELLRTSGAP